MNLWVKDQHQPTDLKAVLIGLQDGVDLGRGEGVAVEAGGGAVAPRHGAEPPTEGRVSGRSLVWNGSRVGLVLAWQQAGGQDLGAGPSSEELPGPRHDWLCTSVITHTELRRWSGTYERTSGITHYYELGLYTMLNTIGVHEVKQHRCAIQP